MRMFVNNSFARQNAAQSLGNTNSICDIYNNFICKWKKNDLTNYRQTQR